MARLIAKGGLRKGWISASLDDADGLAIENIRPGSVCNLGAQDRAFAIECEADPRLASRPAQAIIDGIGDDRAGVDIGPQGRRVLCFQGSRNRPLRSRRLFRRSILWRGGKI